MKKKLVLIGGGGHCKACIDVIESTGSFEIIGILDQADFTDIPLVMGYPVIGNDQGILKYHELGYSFLITVGQLKSAGVRKSIFDVLMGYGADMATVVSPFAYVSKHAELGAGSILMHRVTINAGARIGANCILNTGCNIEHDAIIGSHVHISTLAAINGGCKIGAETFIGSNSTILNQVNIAGNCVIGAGSVVVKDITENGVYVGNPAKRIN